VIERYTLPEIGAVWTEEAKYRAWLEVELAVCRARARLGEIPAEEVEELAEKADFTVERIHEIEAETNHDVIAFVSTVAEMVDSPVSRHNFGRRWISSGEMPGSWPSCSARWLWSTGTPSWSDARTEYTRSRRCLGTSSRCGPSRWNVTWIVWRTRRKSRP
jgi:hypothetical protein